MGSFDGENSRREPFRNESSVCPRATSDSKTPLHTNKIITVLLALLIFSGQPKRSSAQATPTRLRYVAAQEVYPNGIPVPGKKGLVESPFSRGTYVDVANFAAGTQIRDSRVNKIFLVP
jgi:hypothetical protein